MVDNNIGVGSHEVVKNADLGVRSREIVVDDDGLYLTYIYLYVIYIYISFC